MPSKLAINKLKKLIKKNREESGAFISIPKRNLIEINKNIKKSQYQLSKAEPWAII